jgi:hypothetical protein
VAVLMGRVEDKRRAVLTLLNDEEWGGWSNREIARKCGVSDPFVLQLRSLLTVSSDDDSRTYTTKHGTVATMNTTNIGKPATESLSSDDSDTVTRWWCRRRHAAQRLRGARWCVIPAKSYTSASDAIAHGRGFCAG